MYEQYFQYTHFSWFSVTVISYIGVATVYRYFKVDRLFFLRYSLSFKTQQQKTLGS